MYIQLKNYSKCSVVLISIEYECNYRHFIHDICISAIKPYIYKSSFR